MRGWRLAPAVFLVLMPLSGCDEKDPSSREQLVSGGRTPLPDRSGSGSSGEFSPEDPQWRDAVSPASAGPDAEALAQRPRAFFDGDRRALGDLSSRSSVSAYGAWGRPTRKASYTGPARRSALKVSEPPSPAGSAPKAARFDPSRPFDAAKAASGSVLAAFDDFQRRLYTALAPLFSRADWKARERRGRPVAHQPDMVTVHHTQGPQTMDAEATLKAVRAIQGYHIREIGRASCRERVYVLV